MKFNKITEQPSNHNNLEKKSVSEIISSISQVSSLPFTITTAVAFAS